MTRILGIDPGSRITGVGIIDATGQRSVVVHYTRIQCGDGPMPGRLGTILAALGELIATYAPAEVAMENVFVHRNVASALVLGQARGAAICAVAQAGLPLFEYPPAQVKMAIVGRGRAEKPQVQHMVKVLLNLPLRPEADAADALAVALCHAHMRTSKLLNRVR